MVNSTRSMIMGICICFHRATVICQEGFEVLKLQYCKLLFVLLLVPWYVTIIIMDIKLLKGALSGLLKFLATESSLKITKNAFDFTLKAFFCSQDI